MNYFFILNLTFKKWILNTCSKEENVALFQMDSFNIG